MDVEQRFRELVSDLMRQGIPRGLAEEMAAIELDLSAGDIVDTGPDGMPLSVDEQRRKFGLSGTENDRTQ